jgi:hypothetical protein
VRTIVYADTLGAQIFIQVKVVCNSPENKVVMDYLRYPEPVEACDVCDTSVIDPFEIVGYEDGEASLTVNIVGTKPPSARDFGIMMREFYIATGFMWTSDFDQDILSEVYSATEI